MIDDDRGQVSNLRGVIASAVCFAVLLYLVGEFGVGVLAVVWIGLLVVLFIRIPAIIGPASK
jgi:type IV secretory pathway TrbD component